MKPFRQWVYELWMDNCEEHRLYGERELDQRQYFQQYRYWLRREYRHWQRRGQP